MFFPQDYFPKAKQDVPTFARSLHKSPSHGFWVSIIERKEEGKG